jgi:hypothetical protein
VNEHMRSVDAKHRRVRLPASGVGLGGLAAVLPGGHFGGQGVGVASKGEGGADRVAVVVMLRSLGVAPKSTPPRLL